MSQEWWAPHRRCLLCSSCSAAWWAQHHLEAQEQVERNQEGVPVGSVAACFGETSMPNAHTKKHACGLPRVHGATTSSPNCWVITPCSTQLAPANQSKQEPDMHTCWFVLVVPVLIILPSADGADVSCHDVAGAWVDACCGQRWDACSNRLVMIRLHTAAQQRKSSRESSASPCISCSATPIPTSLGLCALCGKSA